jgi:pimeloyl-ACP methyl ester carboxylesterase
MMYKLNLLLLVTAFLLSCDDEASSTTETPVEKNFVSASLNSEISLQTMKSFTASFGQKAVADKLKYSVRSYTFVYKTDFKGETIEASGLLILPVGMTDAAPLMSLQHGTTFSKDEAPSRAGGYTGMELFASAGYIAIVPDFIGYGSSEDKFHPYYDKKYSAMAVIDMIRAAKQYLTEQKIAFNDKLFLAGYSEGGYVTMAAAEEIQRKASHNLTVTAIAAGAGGFDLTEMLKGVTTNTYYAYPSYLAFVLMSYNNTYDWNKPLDYFFQPSYANALSQYMNGEYGGGFINSKLTTDVTKLFNADFYARLKQSDGELQLKQALADNTIAAWKSDAPIHFYHGTRDEIIPYQNTEITAQRFMDAGTENVTVTLIQGGTHGSSFVPMLESFVPWFLSLN